MGVVKYGFILIIFFAAFAGPAKAIIYDDYEQNRYTSSVVDAWGDENDKFSQISTYTLGHFNETVEGDFINPHVPSPNQYRSGAGQDAWLADTYITCSEDSFITGPLYHTSLGSLDLSASSFLKSTFAVDSYSQASLSGTVKATGDYGGNTGYPVFDTYITLRNVLGTEIYTFAVPVDLPSSGRFIWSIDETFLLEPGLYTLEAKSAVFCSYFGSDEPEYDVGGEGSAAVAFSLSIVPEPATLALFAAGAILAGRRRK